MKYNTLHEELYTTRIKNIELKEINTNVKKELMAYYVENEQLKEDYKQKIEDMKSLADEYHILVDKNIKLQTEILDHKVKEARLLKILNETSDYT